MAGGSTSLLGVCLWLFVLELCVVSRRKIDGDVFEFVKSAFYRNIVNNDVKFVFILCVELYSEFNIIAPTSRSEKCKLKSISEENFIVLVYRAKFRSLNAL